MNKYAQHSKANFNRMKDARTFRHCGRKAKFTESAATAKTNEINNNHPHKMKAYCCHFCGGWHLKSNKQAKETESK